MNATLPQLLTPGRIAEQLGVAVHRIQYVLKVKTHIKPIARAGNLRLFRDEAVAQIRYELNVIDARRTAPA